MTLLVIGLDALDARMVEEYDLDGFNLGDSCRIETFANMHDTPFTLEVWPTIATGLPPEEHGVTGAGTSEWSNPVIELASKFTGHLPETTRSRLGDIAESLTGAEWSFGTTNESTIFDGENRAVHNWPGVANPDILLGIWQIMNEAKDGKLSKQQFEREILGVTAEQFGWAQEMTRHDLEVAGVHVHAPDAFGHPYAEDEESLLKMYKRIENFVEDTVAALDDDDELLLLSDHGMQVTWFDDDTPAEHSWYSYASSTVGSPPESVHDVREWVESHATPVESDHTGIQMPAKILRDLGYIE